VRDAEACGINLGNQPYSFIEELCSEGFVQAYLPYAMNDPHPLLAQMIMVPLRWLRQTDPARYRIAGIAAATHKNALVAYGAANAVSYGPNLSQPVAEDAYPWHLTNRNMAHVCAPSHNIGDNDGEKHNEPPWIE